ncbi:MAG TPA: sensor histidine kinase N-terminal domain-containing protein [Ramlibacter sp.]|jgi:two-component system sensor histidine kinase TctE|uniref:sensor histidine kinase n=1 Tax=Ramlibacter sp. TaxID=1917967 RepID=UPI002D42311E|nr:sensor histidine kinase N-terminal domain-containing protein [Ramlibacter sp.]HZY18728.1 sensor histidine kinase N-terminal domain-containing protein [Ramlibacter sp.]
MARAEPRLKSALVAGLLGPLVALLVLDTAIGWWTADRLADQAYDRGLHEIAREVALHVHGGPAGPRLDLSPAAEQALLVDQDDRLALRVWDGVGRSLGGHPDLAPPPRPPVNGTPLFYSHRLGEDPVRVAVSWLPYQGAGPSQRILVQVAETLNKRRRLTWEIVASLLAAQVLLIAMACAAVYWAVGHGLRPLEAIGRGLARRSHQDLSPLDPGPVPLEVRPLVEEVNALMLRLGGALEAQNRFVADAAHQLKTPVAGLKAQIDLALGENDPARVRHSLAQLYVSAERLSRLVQQLLALARNEPGAASAVRLQAVDLEAFALEICMEWAPQALRRSIDLGFEGQERPSLIDADPDRLRDLINNLIDNAVRYSQEGGRVTVKVQAGGDERILSISDDGPTIPPQERTRVFERFHRLLGGKADGSGLGLAIVSEIAALHGARITLEDDADGTGNTFTVHFPPPEGAATAA